LPHGEDERLEALRWILFDNQKVGGYLGPYRFLYFITKPRGDQAVLEFLKSRINNSLGILDQRLSSRAYLLGRIQERRCVARPHQGAARLGASLRLDARPSAGVITGAATLSRPLLILRATHAFAPGSGRSFVLLTSH
jgi:hypothetical protein